MNDLLKREISYARISITDRCNLRCRYCMPELGVEPKNKSAILSYEEILLISSAFAALGIKTLRITGGEPLVRSGVLTFLENLACIKGIDEINLTTNGILLPKLSKDLKKTGVKNINIALNTLDEIKYKHITRCGNLRDALNGLYSALDDGFSGVKINVVVMKGFNDGEIPKFIEMTKHLPIYVRFIELMPIGEANSINEQFLPLAGAFSTIPNIEILEGKFGNGPAKYFKIEGYKGFVGIIDALSNCFCNNCNRVRLTSDGKLLNCLFTDKEFDIRQFLSSNDAAYVASEMEKIIKLKPKDHNLSKSVYTAENGDCNRFMSQVGG